MTVFNRIKPKMFLRSFSIFIAIVIANVASTSFPSHEALPDVFLREMVARMGNDLVDPGRDYIDIPSQRIPLSLSEGISHRAMNEMPSALDYEDLALSPSLRDREYLAHSSLIGTMLGVGKGIQRLKPPSSGNKATAELKTEGVLPAYCNPPNPCPLGYNAEDGCFEEFENTAGFSKDYQALQECMCDTEHMFQCSDSTRESEITALARSIQNEGVLDSTLDKIMAQLDVPNEHLVAKKYQKIQNYNPYLKGEKLPVAAKKGNVWQAKN